jgi:hypothetical protein
MEMSGQILVSAAVLSKKEVPVPIGQKAVELKPSQILWGRKKLIPLYWE